MRTRSVIAVWVLVTACGDDGGSSEPDFEPRAPAEQACRTLALSNATAFEKVNAALCFGIGLPNPQTIGCGFSASTNETRCTGEGFDYVVQWNGNVDGNVFGTVSKDFLGSITQGPQGAFELVDKNGVRAFCTVVGDVATFCLQN